MVQRWLNELLKRPLTREKRFMRLSEMQPLSMMEDLVDMEEVSEENTIQNGSSASRKRRGASRGWSEQLKVRRSSNVWYEELARQSAGGV